ncbi:hypothetical protein PoB_001016800 [Plakobranchus ocellatus]|uniref:Uncharacterized protein n=1 Tax=Plakobranchus ocellatus TaxID=259542 RepID=A0AAV3YN03_9GAST|nr:hypothetical protein PoB_001016800 [Plakobranchus ocellatus]
MEKGKEDEEEEKEAKEVDTEKKEQNKSLIPLLLFPHLSLSLSLSDSFLPSPYPLFKILPPLFIHGFPSPTHGVGGTVDSESALRSAGAFQSRVRAPLPVPWPEITLLWTRYMEKLNLLLHAASVAQWLASPPHSMVRPEICRDLSVAGSSLATGAFLCFFPFLLSSHPSFKNDSYLNV